MPGLPWWACSGTCRRRPACGDVALLGGALGAHLLQVVFALLEVAAVVAGVGGHAAVLERGDVVDAGVHEGAVVTDDEYGAVVVSDKAAQPLDTSRSKWLVGSSSSSRSGWRRKSLASAMRICQPPENSEHGRSKSVTLKPRPDRILRALLSSS